MLHVLWIYLLSASLFFPLVTPLAMGTPLEFGFSHLNAPEQTIQGELYPRHRNILHRGAFSWDTREELVLRALLGDEQAVLMSPFVMALRARLSGKQIDFWISDHAKEQIETILKRIPNLPLDTQEAHAVALQNAYAQIEAIPTEQQVARWINFKAPNHLETTDSIMWASVHPMIGNFFGPHVVEINETVSGGEHRGVDVNYWNYVNNGRWHQDGLPARLSFYWQDAGQTIFPGFLPANAITGYHRHPEFYRPRFKSKHRWQEILNGIKFHLAKDTVTRSPIDVGIYRMQLLSGESFLAIVGADIQTGQADFAHCMARRDTGPGPEALTKIPWLCDTPRADRQITWLEPAPLMGIIIFCQNEQPCKPKQQMWDMFPRLSSLSLPADIAELIERDLPTQIRRINPETCYRYVPARPL